MTRAPRFIAFYLPQFHRIPENDRWWGHGFTEWTNLHRARPLFPGHHQPRMPTEFGFYDLRVADTREEQAAFARDYGVDAFCYWHYWFGNGRRILERPFDEVLASGRPDFPFMLGWANHTWSGVWAGAPGRVLIRQEYPGPEDHRRHFAHVLPAFRDRRYVRVHGRPAFCLFQPQGMPDPGMFLDIWREEAARAGLETPYFIAIQWAEEPDFDRAGDFDALSLMRPRFIHHVLPWLARRALKNRFVNLVPNLLSYDRERRAAEDFLRRNPETVPQVFTDWDNTPRSGMNGRVFLGVRPEKFREHLEFVVDLIAHKPEDEQIVFVRSWNEWAEGNTLEPEQRFGTAFLEAIRDVKAGRAGGESG